MQIQVLLSMVYKKLAKNGMYLNECGWERDLVKRICKSNRREKKPAKIERFDNKVIQFI